MATADGTRRFLQRAVDKGLLHHLNVRPLGQQLSCSAIGFGAYRIGGGDKESEHALALRAAFRAGINLIDTSTHYSAGSSEKNASFVHHGASERLIGRVIAEAISSGEVARDEIVLCTKVGHVARGVETLPEGSVAVGAHGGEGGSGDDWHSIDPSFIEEEVRSSRERFGTSPDYVLLHNPEYFLSEQMRRQVPIADAWDEMYDRLQNSFRTLERLCSEGIVSSGYGVSSNFLSCLFSTTGRPNIYEALVLDRVVDAAASAAKVEGVHEHHFRIAQMPLNIFESGAVLGRGNVVPEAADGDCKVAARLGISVVTNRPINALPMPGVSVGDWGRSGPSHLQLKEAKPMGTMQSLLKRVLNEALHDHGDDTSNLALQQVAMQLSMSSPSVSSTLCGARRTKYVEDVSSVLKLEPLSTTKVHKAFEAIRNAADELGCQKRGLW